MRWRRVASLAAVCGAAILASAAVAAHDTGREERRNPGRGVDGMDLRVASFNVLHGVFCAPDTDFCLAPVRMAMLRDLLQEAGCPALVALEEIGPRQKELLAETIGAACFGDYEVAWQPAAPELAQVVVLSRLPIVERGHLDLAGVPWEAYWVRVQAPVGAVDFLAAHFASGFNNPDCSAEVCPPVCEAGITTNECHAVEVTTFLDGRPPAALHIVAGDLNARPTSATLRTLLGAGFQDVWLLAGHPECARTVDAGCTSGRRRPKNRLDGLDATGGRYRTRIDFVLARPAADCALAAGAATAAASPIATPVDGLRWPSDHAMVVAGLQCGTRSPVEEFGKNPADDVENAGAAPSQG